MGLDLEIHQRQLKPHFLCDLWRSQYMDIKPPLESSQHHDAHHTWFLIIICTMHSCIIEAAKQDLSPQHRSPTLPLTITWHIPLNCKAP